MEKTTGPLAASIEAFINDQTIGGAVLLTGDKNGDSVIETLGYADIAAQKPMQPDTLFWIASNSKQMTSAALMLLADEGKIALGDPVSQHLPEFRGQMFVAEADDEHTLLRKPARPLTVRDLLSHTGGVLPWFHDGHLNAGSLRERTLANALTPLRFEPGTRREYGNGGFEVAGRLIEVLSGLPLEAFMQARLFDPLGMSDTTFWPSEGQLRRLATPHAPRPDGAGLEGASLPFTYPLSELSGSPSPGGGLFSTAGDCFRFCRMVAGGGVFEGNRLLSEASVRAMTTTQTGDLLGARGGESGYGLGWITAGRDHGRPWPEGIGPFHHGGAHGTSLWVDPQRDQIRVFLIAQAAWAPGADSGRPVQAFWDACDQTEESA